MGNNLNNYGYRNNNSNNKGNNKGKNYNNGFNNSDVSNYVGAPYNFVPFSKDIYKIDKNEVPKHDEMFENLYSGEIGYRFKALTPIIVDDGNGNFNKDSYGNYAVPGSSMRGLIRNNVQILGLSTFLDDIDDYKLMYRNVASGAEKKRYGEILGSGTIPMGKGSVSVLKNVQSGVIKKTNSGYELYAIDNVIDSNLGAMNYYVLSERTIADDYKNNRAHFNYSFFRENNKWILQHNIDKGFTHGKDRNGMDQYKGEINMDYKPYQKECYYKNNGRRIVSVISEPREGYIKGWAVSTGKMNMKKSIYIVPYIDITDENNELSPIKVFGTFDNDIKAFNIDLKRKESVLKNFGGKTHFSLPTKNGDTKVVFYINNNGRYYFGFTPRLRLYYDGTIKDGIPRNQKEIGKKNTDYAKAIFGFTNKSEAYKSRVSFTGAKVVGKYDVEGKKSAILAEPKPTSYFDYLVQKGNSTTYNTAGFELRGIKQYWLRDKTIPGCPEGKENEAYVSKFIPLQSGTNFEGTVRFENLKKDELGLLLWAIKLRENSGMNIGKAKAYGYGVIKFEDISLNIANFSKAYSLDEFSTSFYDDTTNQIDSFISEYQSYISGKIGKDINSLDSISDFFDMKDLELKPSTEKIRYMDLGKKEFQTRVRNKKALQTVKLLVRKKTDK